MTRTRTLALSALALSGAVVLAGCSGNGGGTGGDTIDEPITLTLGHAGSESDMRQTAALQLKEIIEEETDGLVTVDVYPNSTLGTWEEMIEGLQLGSTDIVIESLLSLEVYTDLASIETAPFLYDDADAFFEVWDGALGDEIKDSITDASGYVTLGNMYRGPRELTTKGAVTNLSQLQGLTVRTPSAPTMLETWNLLGARAEALPFNEVYSALESGVIDGQENPLDAILFNSIVEVAPHIARTSHMYANYHFILWDDALTGLPTELQEIVRSAADEVAADYTETTISNIAEYEAELEAGGGTFHDITDREAWVEAVRPLIDGLPEQVQEWVTQIRG